jgi:DNA-binding NarL/FixJ family response regulator
VALIYGAIGATAAVAWTNRWRRSCAAAPVVLLELDNAPELILACIEAGAGVYTLRGASAQELAATIISVRPGLARCSPEITACLFDRLAALKTTVAHATASESPLTARELDVLQLICRDYSNRQIVHTLVIELCSVKHHVHNILDKLDQRSRRDAARLAMERGWWAPLLWARSR